MWDGQARPFARIPDPKYRVPLAGEPSPDGGTHVRPKAPLARGEYGLVAIVRGQLNMVEVFDFGVD